MKDTVVAGRYAQALFRTASQPGEAEKARQDLRRFAQLARTDEKLAAALRHPLTSLADKKRLALAALGKPQSPSFERFLELLLSKKRLALLPYIAALFEGIADEAAGVRKAHVKSAAPLSKEQVQELEKRLGRAWNATVSVEASVDESLIGGLTLRAGDRVWDASLRGRLRTLKSKLLESTNT